MKPVERLAVFTAVYPGVERYLGDLGRSLRAQSDARFDLWIALDGLTEAAVLEAIGHDPGAFWVGARPGDTPAQVRQRAWEVLVPEYDAVVMVDADDVLHPTRVAAARRALADADLTACALRLVDADGRDLGAPMVLPPEREVDDLLPRTNVFGLSNTAYRTALLARCLPIPAAARSVDWYLATRAWLLGATIDLDPVARMDYRQHDANMTVVRPPFDADQVRSDTGRVLDHLALMRGTADAAARPDRIRMLEAAAADVAAFRAHVAEVPAQLRTYVERLNRLPWSPRWWAHVARPELRALWAAAT